MPTGKADGFPADRLGSSAGDPMGVMADAIYALKAQYRADANWLMNSATAKVVAKWKDADGRPLWQPPLVAGMLPTLMGYPVEIDEAMSDIGANTHQMRFGDFRRGYLIADAGPLRITVDDNITQPGRIKWYIRKRVGGDRCRSAARLTYMAHKSCFIWCGTRKRIKRLVWSKKTILI